MRPSYSIPFVELREKGARVSGVAFTLEEIVPTTPCNSVFFHAGNYP